MHSLHAFYSTIFLLIILPIILSFCHSLYLHAIHYDLLFYTFLFWVSISRMVSLLNSSFTYDFWVFLYYSIIFCISIHTKLSLELKLENPFSKQFLGKCQSPGSCPYHSTQPNNQKKEIGPSLGMRKSSSLESLQTMMQDLQKEQLEHVGAFTGPRHATVRVSRSRETNESFRAAVDRSYDAPNNGENHETMETGIYLI